MTAPADGSAPSHPATSGVWWILVASTAKRTGGSSPGSAAHSTLCSTRSPSIVITTRSSGERPQTTMSQPTEPRWAASIRPTDPAPMSATVPLAGGLLDTTQRVRPVPAPDRVVGTVGAPFPLGVLGPLRLLVALVGPAEAPSGHPRP